MIINKLTLYNFRNYLNKVFDFSSLGNFIHGANGIGKTNIIEAISLLKTGKGIRNTNIVDMVSTNNPNQPFIIHGEMLEEDQYTDIVTSFTFKNEDFSKNVKRFIRIDGKLLNKTHDLNKKFKIIHYTPDLDQLFSGPRQTRRVFLNKIIAVLIEDYEHKLLEYEYLIKERLKILKKYSGNELLLDTYEKEIVQTGISLAYDRIIAIQTLEEALNLYSDTAIKISLKLTGIIEQKLTQGEKNASIEAFYLERLYEQRLQDQIIGRTMFGPHRSDLKVMIIGKNMDASNSSTGEQKIIILLIIMAAIRALTIKYKDKPIILMDDLYSHLDNNYFHKIVDELTSLKTQFIITTPEKPNFTLNNSWQTISL